MKSILLLLASFPVFLSQAQRVDSIITGLRSINTSVTNVPCSTGRGNIISNRAMNIFLSEKIGYYLSANDDLSLYKNAVTFNTAEGVFSVLHNLRQANGSDEPVKSSVFIGAKANILNGFEAALNNRHFVNDFGLLVKKVWMGKTNTRFSKCGKNSLFPQQKQNMDAVRASILNLLIAEIRQKDSVFHNSLSPIDAAQFPYHDLDSIKEYLLNNFYTDLEEEYSRKFAALQAEALSETNNYNLVTSCWTSFGLYIPLLSERIFVAPSFTGNFKSEHLYPLEIFLAHTRFWESRKYGRVFLKLSAHVFANSAYHSKSLQVVDVAAYKAQGGTDITHIPQQNSAELFIGPYRNFITSQLNVSFAYFPPDWHFGLSGLIGQNFGKYNALNGKIGLPVVLIDKKGVPAINFEFQVLFSDISKRALPEVKLADKASVGFSIGVPFSKIVY